MNDRISNFPRTIHRVYLCIFFSAFSLITACGGGGGQSPSPPPPSPPPANVAPTVSAGEDQSVDDQTTVTLTASASDSDGTIASYSWSQTDGREVTIENADSAEASFITLASNQDTSYSFSITVEDNDGASATDSVRITVTPTGLKVLALANPPVSKPNYVIKGKNGGTSIYQNRTGDIKQILYESKDKDVRTRVIFDERTNEPEKIVDEITGGFIALSPNGNDRIDFYHFDADGDYQSGTAVYVEGGEYYSADIIGIPSFEGQITGQLIGARRSGSFALVADQTTTLDDITSVDEDLSAMMDLIASIEVRNGRPRDIIQILYEAQARDFGKQIQYDRGTNGPGKIVDNVSGHFAILVENGDRRIDIYHFDSDGYYQSGEAIYSQGGRYLYADIVGTPSFEGQYPDDLNRLNHIGRFILTPDQSTTIANMMTVDSKISLMASDGGARNYPSFDLIRFSYDSALRLSLAKTLKIGGIAVGGLALAGFLPPAYGAAGVAMLMSGLFSDQIGTFVANKFKTDNPLAQELVDLAVEQLQDSDRSIEGFWERIKDNVNDGVDFVSELVQDAKDNLREFTDESEFADIEGIDGPSDDELASSLVPISEDGPAIVDAHVSGQAVNQDGVVYKLDGTVIGDGTITASGASDDGSDNIQIDGTIDKTNDSVSGSFSTNDDSGSIDGETQPLGSCDVSTGSGGRGTFTFAHNVGVGVVQFYYDAYSIPDRFTVRNAGGIQFDTGRLVSGSRTVTLNLSTPIVFVSVSAPRSGTLWEYSIGCAEAS